MQDEGVKEEGVKEEAAGRQHEGGAGRSISVHHPPVQSKVISQVVASRGQLVFYGTSSVS